MKRLADSEIDEDSDAPAQKKLCEQKSEANRIVLEIPDSSLSDSSDSLGKNESTTTVITEEVDEELEREIEAIINAGCNNNPPPSVNKEDPPLSPSQQRAFDAVVMRYNLFITGNAGSGKSFLIKRIIAELSKRRLRGVLTASTGIAAWNIGGVTAHSFAGMGLANKPIGEYTRSLKYKPDKVKEWKELDVLIVDECSMLGVDFFGKLDAMARFARDCQKPFGGLQVILIGDYFQLPSVEKDFEEFDEQGERRPRFLFQMPLWKEAGFQSIALKENFRQQGDRAFFELLERVKVSKTTLADEALLESRLIERHPLTNPNDLIKLCPRRATAQAINQEELDKIKGEAHQFMGTLVQYNDKGQPIPQQGGDDDKKQQQDKYPVDVNLVLKAGAEVLLCVNMSQWALFNGSRGTVLDFRKEEFGGLDKKLYPYVRFETGQELLIKPNTWECHRRGRLTSTFTQVPLILRYAVTIHKAQGLTLGRVLVTGNSFENGQDYVAFSRVQRLTDLFLQHVDMSTITTSQAVIDFYTANNLL